MPQADGAMLLPAYGCGKLVGVEDHSNCEHVGEDQLQGERINGGSQELWKVTVD